MASERWIKRIYRTGMILAGLSLATFIGDTVVTSNAADAQGLKSPSPERTTFINDFRGWRSSGEIGLGILSVFTLGASVLLQNNRENRESIARRNIIQS